MFSDDADLNSLQTKQSFLVKVELKWS